MKDGMKTFTLHQTNVLFKGFFEFSELKVSHSLYKGGVSEVLGREVFSRNQAVIVLLYDSQNEQVVLVEQFRPGAACNALANGNQADAWLIEPVAGMIEVNEDPMTSGIRETAEETGVTVDALEYVCQFYPSPGACDEILHLYAADIDSTDVGEHGGLTDEYEDIKVIKMSFEEAQRRFHNAEFNVASTFIALQWLFNQKLVVNL